MGFQVIVHLSWVILLFAVRGSVVAKVSAAGHECRNANCSRYGPEIRFPFWIIDKQPEQCGYPGFGVLCHEGETLLHIEYLANTSLQGTQIFLSNNLSLFEIDYKSQKIVLGESGYSFTNNLKLVSTSTSLPSALFHFGKIRPENVDQIYDKPNTTFFNCSSTIQHSIPAMLTYPGGQTFPVDCLHDFTDNNYYYITNCTKVFSSSLPFNLLDSYYFEMEWSIPDCRECEAKGEYCELMNNITGSNGTACVPKPQGKWIINIHD